MHKLGNKSNRHFVTEPSKIQNAVNLFSAIYKNARILRGRTKKSNRNKFKASFNELYSINFSVQKNAQSYSMLPLYYIKLANKHSLFINSFLIPILRKFILKDSRVTRPFLFSKLKALINIFCARRKIVYDEGLKEQIKLYFFISFSLHNLRNCF